MGIKVASHGQGGSLWMFLRASDECEEASPPRLYRPGLGPCQPATVCVPMDRIDAVYIKPYTPPALAVEGDEFAFRNSHVLAMSFAGHTIELAFFHKAFSNQAPYDGLGNQSVRTLAGYGFEMDANNI
jgi:hypothetical protein